MHEPVNQRFELASAFACEQQGRLGRHRRAGDCRICHRAATSAPRPRWLALVRSGHDLSPVAARNHDCCRT
jgi:hypothetical protein